jgi:uncharacterized protein YdeI (YjbR/CyaY-like superfamily)
MPATDPRVDAYIAASAPFAQPILRHLRAVVHAACPDVEETLRWRMPFFVYGGGLLCYLAAFTRHCRFGFWKGALVFTDDARAPKGHFERITAVADLPPRAALIRLVKRAMAINDQGMPSPTRGKAAVAKRPTPPKDFRAALDADARAKSAFTDLSPSCQREYVAWITQAKREETRRARIATAVGWIAQGKSRNWKYERPRPAAARARRAATR